MNKVKRIAAFILCLTMILMISVTAFAEDYIGYGYVTASDGAKLRSGPGKMYSAGALILPNEYFDIIDADNPSWLHVRVPRTPVVRGYLHTSTVWYTLDESIMSILPTG